MISFPYRNSNQNHPRTAEEVVERRRALQKQKEAAFLKLRAELERAHHVRFVFLKISIT